VIAVIPTPHTVAYWRFEDGPAGAQLPHGGGADGVFAADIVDSSGNGNALSTWTAAAWAGEAYRTDVPASTVPNTHATNHFSIKNTGGYPGMFTGSDAMRSMTPAAWTVEASFKPETGGYRTLVGRDSRGANTAPGGNADLSALYFQIQPDNSVAIKFCDVAGYWHEAISAGGLIHGFDYPSDHEGVNGHWYDMAGVSDGQKLSLYLNDVTAGTGYQLVAQTDMTTSGSSNTALTAGMGSGGDWQAGNWSVMRGLYAGGHTDRGYGFIDEVRISDAGLDPSQFLFAPEYMFLLPNTLNMAPMDIPNVSLVIPTSCNESQAVDVTVTSDNAATAKPAGSAGSAVVHFAAGAGRMQPLAVETGSPGVAHFTLSATGGCPAGPGAALTVTVNSAQSLDLQVIYDIVKVGQTQQATVMANFGSAGTRNVTAASTGTTYSVVPSGILSVSPDGLITANALGSATITASYEGKTSPARTVVVATPNPNPRPKIAGSGFLLVDLSATDATAGQATWINKGSLGDFAAIGHTPAVGLVAGVPAVSFDGTDGYQGPMAPVELLGGQGRSIEVWAYNPVIECTPCIETMVAWSHRGGPDASHVAFGFGDHPQWGAFAGWGLSGDMGWYDAGGSPPLGQWRHLVYTYDPADAGGTTRLYDNGIQLNWEATGAVASHPGHINLCMQNLSENALDLFNQEIGNLSLAAVRVHDGALTPDQVLFNYRAGPNGHGLIGPDLDLNGRVDALDFTLFTQCVAGPDVPVTGDCVIADFDGDSDVDQNDFAIFQRCYSGPMDATPGCG